MVQHTIAFDTFQYAKDLKKKLGSLKSRWKRMLNIPKSKQITLVN